MVLEKWESYKSNRSLNPINTTSCSCEKQGLPCNKCESLSEQQEGPTEETLKIKGF